jgi:hypothetical protein
MNRSLTMAFLRTVSKNNRISRTVMTDIKPSGYIMIPPFARISRMFVCLICGDADSAAAERVATVTKKLAIEIWQHFME